AVGRTRAVERGRVRTLQHRDRLDVHRIDVGCGVPVVDPAARAAAETVVRGRAVVDRDAVDHEERLVVAADRAGAADDDARRAADQAGAGDLHARGLPGQRVDEVEIRHGRDVRAGDLLDGVADLALLARNPERGHDQPLEPDRLDLHLRVDRRAGDLGLDGGVPDHREDQRARAGRDPDRVVPGAIGGRADRRALHDDLYT